MKLKSLIMFSAAALAFAACSNEEEGFKGQNLDGNGVVEVSIVAPTSRALVDGTEGNEAVVVTGPITVKLTAGSGIQTEEIDPSTGGTHTVKFYGVTAPTKVEAYVNNGDTEGQGATDITLMQDEPEKIPAYGSTESFNLSGKAETVEGITYEMYSASVKMAIPVARLEVSGIKHVTHPVKDDPDEATCDFATLTIDGIYLDKVKTTATGKVEDYCMPADEENDIPAPILFDEIESASFLAADAVWPAEEGKAYAYNFYPDATQQPLLKIYFANATSSDPTNPAVQPRYAVIKTYNGDPNFKFEAGKIYRIKDVTLKDKNIIVDEEGNATYGVDVTVEEAVWTPVDITGQWEEY